MVLNIKNLNKWRKALLITLDTARRERRTRSILQRLRGLTQPATMIFDKLKKFDIVFDSPEVDCPPVFSSGDVVSGRVVLDLSGESRVESLKLHAEGFAKVHWTESRSAGSSTAYTQNYSDEVEYLNRREVLLQAGQSAVMGQERCCVGAHWLYSSEPVS